MFPLVDWVRYRFGVGCLDWFFVCVVLRWVFLFSASLRYSASPVLDCNPGVFIGNILLSLVVSWSNFYLALTTLFGLLSAPVWTWDISLQILYCFVDDLMQLAGSGCLDWKCLGMHIQNCISLKSGWREVQKGQWWSTTIFASLWILFVWLTGNSNERQARRKETAVCSETRIFLFGRCFLKEYCV